MGGRERQTSKQILHTLFITLGICALRKLYYLEAYKGALSLL